jgi:hypothetical protein
MPLRIDSLQPSTNSDNLSEPQIAGGGDKTTIILRITAGVKTKCCKSYQRKGKACKKCPVMAHLDPKALKQWRKHKK